MIVHTDRASVYCGRDHRNQIRRHGLIASMSGRGNCYDEAVVESYFHSLKVESIHGVPLMHPDALCHAHLETIEVEYNRTRRHSALGTISPDAFGARMMAQSSVQRYWERSNDFLAFYIIRRSEAIESGWDTCELKSRARGAIAKFLPSAIEDL